MRDDRIVALLWTVFGSILQVFIICFAGWFLARCGILDKRTQKQLNRINVSLFTPCLLFSKVAFFLTPQKLKELWIIPVFFVLVTVVSMVVAGFLGTLFRLRNTQRNFAIAASMFMNSNSLPIALMQSLVITVPNLQWGDDDSQEAMVGRALTYLVLYSTLGMILRWSYGVHLLQQSDELTASADPESAQIVQGGQSPFSDVHRIAESDVPQMNPPPKKVFRKSKSSTFRRNTGPSNETSPTLTTSASSSRENLVSTDSAPERDALHEHGHGALRPSDSQLSTTSTLAPHRERGGLRDSGIFYSFPNTPVRSRTDLSTAAMRRQRLRRAVESDTGSEDEDEDEVNGGNGADNENENEDNEEGGETTPLLGANASTTSTQQRRCNQCRRSNYPFHTCPHRRRQGSHPPTFLSSLTSHITSLFTRVKAFLTSINKFMTVPLYVSLLSLVVALIPPLQHFLSVHAGPLKGAVASVGSCSIPVTLVVLGGYFWVPEEEKAEKTSAVMGGEETARPGHANVNGNGNGNGNGSIHTITALRTSKPQHQHQHQQPQPVPTPTTIPIRRPNIRRKSLLSARQDPSLPGETRTVWVSILSRMILVPLLIFPLLFWGAIIKFEEEGGVNVLEDPVFMVSLVLLVSSPPALTLAQITQKASGDAFERLISRTIFWAYCVATPPLTIVYVVLGLWLANLSS